MFDAQGQFTELYDWICQTSPQAAAAVQGPDGQGDVNGIVYFYQTEMGALLLWSVGGLPVNEDSCEKSIFAMHIHEGGNCSSRYEDEATPAPTGPFPNAGGHYNPYGCPHPYHAGDLPPLFSNGGYAFGAVLTSRFGVEEVIGRTVIIHGGTDDFKTQPSGDAGPMIACGVIRRLD